jgi:hypothetical protein
MTLLSLHCGGDADTISAYALDPVATDCELVKRS